MKPDFWCGRRILVTGHTGFKGAWLSRRLADSGANVCGLALPPAPYQEPILQALEIERSLSACYWVDVCDYSAVRKSVEICRPEFIFHLAAQSLVGPSYTDPVRTFQTNVSGTLHMLEAASEVEAVRGILIVTSDKCYRQDSLPSPRRETDPLGGTDPYSASKGCAELVATAYRAVIDSRKRGLRIATARAGNVIGGGDFAPDRLIPDLVRGVFEGSRVSLRCPEAVRPWQFVLEPLRGYLMIGEGLLHGRSEVEGAWNFGPDPENEWTTKSVATAFSELIDPSAKIEAASELRNSEDPYLSIDSHKAKSVLGWRPLVDLTTALRMAAEWYTTWYRSPRDIKAVSLRQLSAYEQLIVPEKI